MAVASGLVDQGSDGFGGIAAADVDADGGGDVDRRRQSGEALDVVGPHAGLQPQGLGAVADVDRVGVHADRCRDGRVQRGDRHGTAWHR